MIDSADWIALETGDDPFVSPVFLGAIERLNARNRHPALQWQADPLVLRSEGGAVAAMLPRFLRTHSFGDFSRDWGWPEAWTQAGVPYYPKWVTGIPYTPSPGPRLLVRAGLDYGEWASRLVAQAIEEANVRGVGSWQCLFVEERDRAVLAAAGCLMRRGVQFHWANAGWADFDEFLGSFTAEKRKKLKRERRAVVDSGLRLVCLHGDEITPALWRQLHPLYAETFLRYGNHPALSADFFAEVGAGLGRRMVVFVAYDDEEPVACAICYRDRTTLYGRHWGCRQQIPGLHFELCLYKGIEYCLREGLERFEPGAQGEHKLARGFAPTDTWSAFYIPHTGLRAAVADYLAREALAIGNYAEETARHLPFRFEPQFAVERRSR